MGKSGIRAQQCFRGRRSLSDLKKDLIQKLIELRAQGMVIADINPISALEMISLIAFTEDHRPERHFCIDSTT